MKKLLSIAVLVIFCTAISSAQVAKSVSILGDSYSTFEGYLQPDTNYVWYFAKASKSTDVTSVRETWWHKFIKDNGYTLCVNNSFSGATICNTGYHREDYSDRSFMTRMKKLGRPNIIFIFGGTNDSWANSPIGEYEYSSWTKHELYSFRPALAYLLENMIDYYPNVEIYFILNCELKPEISESSKTICAHYNIPCIELKDIDKKNGHPTIKGMSQIAEQLKNFISKK